MAGWLDGIVFNSLERAMDATNLRNKTLANNIANIDTPNFKRSDIDFQGMLEASMGKGDHLPLRKTRLMHLDRNQLSEAFIVQDLSSSIRRDGNNVDVDLEMARLGENTLQYNALTRILSSQLSLLKQVVRE